MKTNMKNWKWWVAVLVVGSVWMVLFLVLIPFAVVKVLSSRIIDGIDYLAKPLYRLCKRIREWGCEE